MPKITININHKLGQIEALARIKKYLVDAPRNFPSPISGFKIDWYDPASQFNFQVANLKVNGKLVVGTEVVSIISDLPFVFYPLKNQIENIVKEHAKTILS